ncbi:MAG: dockerin type I domain-containing protein [Ruminococcus sp.]
MRKTLKRLLPIMVALMFILSSLPVGAVDTQDSVTFYKIGDANADKKIDINDVTKIQKALAEIIPADNGVLIGGDANGDGETDIRDVTQIQRVILDISYIYYPYDKYPRYKITKDPIKISGDNVINSQVLYAEDEMQPGVITESGGMSSFVSIIRTKEELASFTDCHSPELDDEFFKENSLIVAHIYTYDSGDFYSAYSLENIKVEGNTLTAGIGTFRKEGYSPFVDGIDFYFPMWCIINKVSKEDVSAVDNIVCSFKYSVE